MSTLSGVQGPASFRILLDPSPLPYNYPQLDLIQREWFRPAFETGIDLCRKRVEEISSTQEKATFENTVIPLEKSNQELHRAKNIFFSLTSSDSDDTLRQIQTEFFPKFAELDDFVYMNEDLYRRTSSIHLEGLDAESRRLLQELFNKFRRHGAELSPKNKQKLAELNQEISRLEADFEQACDKGMIAGAVLFTNVADLDGLDPDQISAAGEAARKRGHSDAWLLALSNTTMQSWLKKLKNRSVRERIYRASISRGLEGAPYSTVETIKRIAKLRAERAQLLSYKHHADYAISDNVARDFGKVSELLSRVAEGSLKKARKEALKIQKEMEMEIPNTQLCAWDWAYYAESIRQKKYSFSESDVRPYFEMNRVLHDGVLYASQRLFGITAKPCNNLPVYHPDVMVYELFNEDGSGLGIVLFDYYARDSKTGGGWMSCYTEQSDLMQQSNAVVLNNLNIPKPAEGMPTLMTFDEVRTAFHEFGHALHGLFSRVKYPRFSGINVPMDYCEFPSQLNEMWSYDREVLSNFARHYETNELIPEPLLEKVLSARRFNQGFDTLEYTSAAILDQAWHQITPETDIGDVSEFEKTVLKNLDLNGVVGPRYRLPYFKHIFATGYSYAAGYYSYKYADLMVRCIEQWIGLNGGLCREIGDTLRSKVLSKGFSIDPYAAFVDLYGAELSTGPLFEHLGFED